MSESNKHHIRLLFNANKVYDRQVIEGIGHYLQSSKVQWDVYLEEDYLTRLNTLNDWKVDGIIADYDDPQIEYALQKLQLPIVGVGGSYEDESAYPQVPYVATDNVAIVKMAFEHLKQKGIESFAFYGLPLEQSNTQCRWALEREKAIIKICQDAGFDCAVYRGHHTSADSWHKNMSQLSAWIKQLKSPVGILAVTDARARHLVQICEHIGLVVPDQVSIIGIDDDDIARNLSRVGLSSVSQGCFEMGFQAAKLLHKRLNLIAQGHPIKPKKLSRIQVPPLSVVQRQSTDFQALVDPYVIQAMHFIRQHACNGIKVDQVLDFVGISRSNLEQRFVDECGHSVHTQIHNQKLNVACDLLQNTNSPLVQVAKNSGYPSLQYMYAIFKKHYNMTPNQYRRQFDTN